MALTSDHEESVAVNSLLKRNDCSKDPNSPHHPHPIWTSEMLLLFLVMVFWSSDNMALPAVYAEIAQTFGLTVSDLSILGLVRGIFESICALPAGILAERLERPWLIAWGCSIWAGALGACAFAPNLRWMIVFRAVNGIGLGMVQPLLFSLVADKTGANGRGRAFGMLLCTGNLGQTAFTAFATSIAPWQFGPLLGWQLALMLIAAMSAFTGILVGFLVTDVGTQVEEEIGIVEMPRFGQIFRLPTFMIIIGQGIFGTAPWFAFSYLTMWLELNCFAHYQAALIYTCFNLGSAVSNVLGGFLLDALCHRFPDHGPPAMAQSASFLSIPLFGIIFFALNSASGADVNRLICVYCFTFFVTGTLISWNMVVNNKMMSDVVPRKSYTYIYALDRAIEGTFGSFGQPCVGWLADHMFQYNPNRANTLRCSPSDAASLGQGVFSVSVSGCGVCFFLFSLAHCTYPRDRRRAWELGSMSLQ